MAVRTDVWYLDVRPAIRMSTQDLNLSQVKTLILGKTPFRVFQVVKGGAKASL